jgi:hypothetical protein
MDLMPIYRCPDTSRKAKGRKIYPYLLRSLRIEHLDQSLHRTPGRVGGGLRSGVWRSDIIVCRENDPPDHLLFRLPPDAGRLAKFLISPHVG